MRICLDPGHGGGDPGAIGPNGTKEKNIALEVCLMLRSILEKRGYDILLTRGNDRNVGLDDRVSMANQCRFFVSIHCNSFSSESAEGVETVYSKRLQGSQDLAGMVQDALASDPFSPRRHKDRGLKLSPSPEYQRNIYVVQNSQVPSCLAELEFISHPHWEQYLKFSYPNYALILADALDRFAHSLKA